VIDLQERPNTLPWPPIIVVGGVALAILLHYLVPLPWLRGPLAEFLFAIGWLVVAGAIALFVTAIRAMERHRTTVRPDKGSEFLVTDGPFSFTRNPIYLANAMAMIGLGLIAGIPWLPILAIVVSFVTQKLAIEREEKHLELRFGKRFRDYAKKVRRWI
jgi:protein-S-isoprenylcysteine O-methyltransferase Ste14